MNPNTYLYQPQFGGSNPGGTHNFSRQSPIPASSIEQTMFWLDRIAEQHDWVNRYSDPLIGPSGFWWKRDNGIELEGFTPNSGQPYQLAGYPTSARDFWQYFRRIIEWIGPKTLKYYETYGGAISGTNSTYNESGWRWGSLIDDQWYLYGNSTSFGIEVSGIDFNDASHTKYMGNFGKMDYNDYLQYTPTTYGGSLDTLSFTATKLKTHGHGYTQGFTTTIPSGYSAIYGVIVKNPGPYGGYDIPEDELYMDYIGIVNSGYAYCKKYPVTHVLVTFPPSGLFLHDAQITTNNRYHTQALYDSYRHTLLSDCSPYTSGWSFNSTTDSCEGAYILRNEIQLSEKNLFSVPGPLTNIASAEYFGLTQKVSLSIPIICTYVSRYVRSATSGDHNYNDGNHYLRSFTGFTPNDPLELTSNLLLKTSSYSSGYPTFSSGTSSPYQDFISSLSFPPDVHWYQYSSGIQDIVVRSNGDAKIVYGFANYNPYENNQLSGTILATDKYTTNLQSHRDILGQRVIDKIYANNYTQIGTITPSGGSMHWQNALFDGYLGHWTDDIVNRTQRYLGSISGMVDMEPTDNILWFAVLPGEVNPSSMIFRNAALPEYTFNPLDNHTPEEGVLDQSAVYNELVDVYRTSLLLRNGVDFYPNQPKCQEKTSYYSLNSGQDSYQHLLGRNFVLLANTTLVTTQSD